MYLYDYYIYLLILGLREGWRTEISQQAEIPDRTLWAWPSGKYWNILKLRAAWSGMKMHMCTCNDEVAGCVSQRQLIRITAAPSFTSIAKHHVCPLIVINSPPRVFAKRWECEIEESWPCFLACGWTCVRKWTPQKLKTTANFTDRVVSVSFAVPSLHLFRGFLPRLLVDASKLSPGKTVAPFCEGSNVRKVK